VYAGVVLQRGRLANDCDIVHVREGKAALNKVRIGCMQR
jgi:hypothetical protein